MDLEELFETMKGKDLEIEDIPDGSVVVFDDLESFPKNIRKKYMDLRDTFLERGRGHSEGQKGISTITVSHNARNGNATKASIRESQYWVLFPTANKVDVKNLFKLYGGLDTKDIDLLMNQKSRWCFFKKSIPQYAIGEHSIVVI